MPPYFIKETTYRTVDVVWKILFWTDPKVVLRQKFYWILGKNCNLIHKIKHWHIMEWDLNNHISPDKVYSGLRARNIISKYTGKTICFIIGPVRNRTYFPTCIWAVFSDSMIFIIEFLDSLKTTSVKILVKTARTVFTVNAWPSYSNNILSHEAF